MADLSFKNCSLGPKTAIFGPKRPWNTFKTAKRRETVGTLYVQLDFPVSPSSLRPRGRAEKKIPPGGEKFFFQPRHLSPPNPVYKNFYPRGTFSTPTPHCPHWARRPPPLEPPTPLPPPPLAPPQTPPQPPCSAAPTEILWRLPRLPWPGVANHMPPILGPTHGAPGSKHNSTNCPMDCSHVYVQEHIDLLTLSLSQREETTAPAQCPKA